MRWGFTEIHWEKSPSPLCVSLWLLC